MYRHLYKSQKITHRYLLKEIVRTRYEDSGFKYAALQKIRSNEFNYDELIQLEPQEHWEIARTYITPQIFRLLSNLHKFTRKETIIQHPQIEQINRMTSLIDPNMFPILDLSEKINSDKYVSVWQQSPFQVKLHEKIGFLLEIKKSNIDHVEAGNGVFLRTKEPQPPGTLLGFVPGMIFDSYYCFNNQRPPDMHFARLDGSIVDYEERLFYPRINGFDFADYMERINERKHLTQSGKQAYKNKDLAGFMEIDFSEVNPYAVGHKINHTPRNKQTNVCLVDLFVPHNFFNYEYMKFWPNIEFSKSYDKMDYQICVIYDKKQYTRGLGIMSLTQIEDNEELYLDYLESDFFDLEGVVPDWLVKPPPHHPSLDKIRKKNKMQKYYENLAFQQLKSGTYDNFISKIREKQYI